ncbi:MAG TPA: hypothetical protein VFC31_02660 [Candidatus Limnocylindria bacterium]|nr:hypothetical protein [Candidatus Limnocylindria bacterium]
MAASSALREHILDLLWSQWHELGISSTVPRRHEDDCIDPEPLIAFTAVHGDLDARLRDESIDWVLRYGTYVSRARLKNILAAWGALENPRFREYAATVNAGSHAGWPAGRAKALAFRPRARALLADLSAPALLSLRIRALFGVGARAELLRSLLARPREARTAAELAIDTSYGKRNVLNELEPLRFGGLVKSFRVANADRYQLVRIDELAALLRPLPSQFTPWTQVYASLHLVLDLVQRGVKRSDLQNAVDALRLLEEQKTTFARADVQLPAMPRGAEAWRLFLEWATEYARSLARP